MDFVACVSSNVVLGLITVPELGYRNGELEQICQREWLLQ